MILICFGTRPEWLKIKPLLPHIPHKLLFTGQHQDLVDEVDFDYHCRLYDEGNNRLDSVITCCLRGFPDDPDIDSVLVQGDTASAFACALAGFNRKLNVLHLEAGLRTNDLDHPYPEEGYRQMISRIATGHFCPTEDALKNLHEEKAPWRELGIVVGNTVLDNLVESKGQFHYGNQVLITLHRRENHDIMPDWFKAVDELAAENPDLEFVLPIHPNPNVKKHADLLTHVKVVEPMDHGSLISMLQSCLLTITDSGGIQEEASFFNKKSIVCREVTERPEGIATGHTIMCPAPEILKEVFQQVKEDPTIEADCPYGDGYAALRVKAFYEKDQALQAGGRIPQGL